MCQVVAAVMRNILRPNTFILSYLVSYFKLAKKKDHVVSLWLLNWRVMDGQLSVFCLLAFKLASLFEVQRPLKTPWFSSPRHCLSNKEKLLLHGSRLSARNVFSHRLINGRSREAADAAPFAPLRCKLRASASSSSSSSSRRVSNRQAALNIDEICSTGACSEKRLNRQVAPTCSVDRRRQLPVFLGGDVFPVGRPQSQPLPTPLNVEIAISRPVSRGNTQGGGKKITYPVALVWVLSVNKDTQLAAQLPGDLVAAASSGSGETVIGFYWGQIMQAVQKYRLKSSQWPISIHQVGRRRDFPFPDLHSRPTFSF